MPRREVSGKSGPAHSLISDFWPPGLAEINVCGLNCPVCGVGCGGPKGLIQLPKTTICRRENISDKRLGGEEQA